MKIVNVFKVVAGFVLGLMLAVSCETEAITSADNNSLPAVNKVAMKFVAAQPSYDSATKADASEGEWADKSKVFLQFVVGDKVLRGSAVYDYLEDLWTLEYTGTLQDVESAPCEAYYFENAGEATLEEVPLTEKTAVYQDKSATYSFSFKDNLVVIKAHLKPYLSRVRLEGKHKQGYNFDGPLHYTSYNLLENKFVSSSKMICDTIPESGKTGYYYLYFENEANKEMCFFDYVSGDKFTRVFPEGAFALGKSGYLNAPTAESHSGWVWDKLYMDIKVYDETIRMIRVEPGTFMMGDETGTDSSSMPVHKVTLTKPYYISETEVTQPVWKAVYGTSPSTYVDVSRPVQQVPWNTCSSFISKLNEYTGKTFRFPTEAEWEFAARGGNMSKGYKYSGSDKYDEVAVFGRNSYTGTTTTSMSYGTQSVKSKKPNELGLYDMSGNVLEWCQDWYGVYSSADQTDPKGPASNESSYKVLRGGYWYQSSKLLSYRDNASTSATLLSYKGSIGLRLVMEP